MKFYKGLMVVIVTFLLGSCFEPPSFPVVPKIEFERVEFIDNPGDFAFDSLILHITFQDGDGDLGIDPTSLKYISAPFNNLTFYQGNPADPTNLIPIQTTAGVSGKDTLHLLDIPDPSLGKLVFPRTRKQAGFGYLPAYDDCATYEFIRNSRFLVSKDDLAALDKNVKIVDSVYRNVDGHNETLYRIQDTLYYSVNQDHYNIDVDFLVKDPGNPNADSEGFVEHDWRAENCKQSFDGRFPVLTDRENALEGSLKYTMKSTGFNYVFSIKTLKLRIQIKDRMLNSSNVIYTNPFTLDQI